LHAAKSVRAVVEQNFCFPPACATPASEQIVTSVMPTVSCARQRPRVRSRPLLLPMAVMASLPRPAAEASGLAPARRRRERRWCQSERSALGTREQRRPTRRGGAKQDLAPPARVASPPACRPLQRHRATFCTVLTCSVGTPPRRTSRPSRRWHED